jgi:type IV secretory pathway VirB6-like protein
MATSVVAAIILLVATLIQTIYSVLSYYHGWSCTCYSRLAPPFALQTPSLYLLLPNMCWSCPFSLLLNFFLSKFVCHVINLVCCQE